MPGYEAAETSCDGRDDDCAAGVLRYLVWTGRAMWLTHDDANGAGGLASILGVAAGGPAQTVALGADWAPAQAAFDGRNVGVTDRNNARLRIVDAWTGADVRTVGGGLGGHYALAFDGARVRVSNGGAGTLLAF